MAQAHSNPSIADRTYTPPPLPEYLSRNHTLNTIVGVPTDQEVKAIHNTIRAVNSISTVPVLYDHKLSTQLAQYLFTVQMAIYRNEYPSGMFPGENTYTPPSIPSHFPISLDPVVGAPSDEELESVHSAVRTLEGLVHSPFYDAALSVKLSQHLFNIQFARYTQDTNQGHFTQRPANPAPRLQNDPPVDTQGRQADITDPEEPQDTSSCARGHSQATPLDPAVSNQRSISRSNDELGRPSAPHQLEETNRILGENEKLLRVIIQTLLSTHFNATRSTGAYSSYRVINDKGELPWMRKLPSIDADSDTLFRPRLAESELVGYLKF